MDGMKIGDAAVTIGVDAHVLRHWESVGLLRPPRSGSGHRCYDAQSLDQARLVRTLRRAGLSLRRIGELRQSGRNARLALIEEERSELQRRIELLTATDRFLAHTLECEHPIIADCPQCSGFTTAESTRLRTKAWPRTA
ncbi:MerR family transcriptional regulator [Ruania zhangjianzhongii]|uniref:MerR family transcriptional regulator n=1 Tax=Ruania zhangjianzhongii TaxID=2603206 RepID=UPI0011C82023|nr:MerR family transcriptional regulator [Ruania zhangjianzhongii]